MAWLTLSCELISKSAGDDLPQPVVDSLARIRRSVSYMTQLVNDLLALAQVGNAPFERAEIDLSQLCEEIVANLRLASPERQVTVEVAPGLRCNVDASLMRAAMENLIGNAWKYSARVAHARIEIGTMAVDGRDVFFVRDNGAGFDMTLAHRLFAPFQRLHAPNEFDGTGVGLAAVQRIIERHGGHIWAEGATGHGATFFFTMP